MKEIHITDREAGEKLERLLQRLLPQAPVSFLFKMLRKKNITLNDHKADGKEKLMSGDVVKIWFSDETYQHFAGENGTDDSKEWTGGQKTSKTIEEHKDESSSRYPYVPLEILLETDDVIFINKPAGMLSQKAAESDRSLCEYLIGYLLHEHKITERDLRLCKPSACNRLDRGTTGLVACGISIRGLQELSMQIQSRSVKKVYACLVRGVISREQVLEDYLIKDRKANQVTVLKEPAKDTRKIITHIRPVKHGRSFQTDWTLLEVELITGRSHQIRAHMASIGHPVLGDNRYGDRQVNRHLEKEAGITHQLLHAMRMEFPDRHDAPALLRGCTIEAPLPKEFADFMDDRKAVPGA